MLGKAWEVNYYSGQVHMLDQYLGKSSLYSQQSKQPLWTLASALLSCWSASCYPVIEEWGRELGAESKALDIYLGFPRPVPADLHVTVTAEEFDLPDEGRLCKSCCHGLFPGQGDWFAWGRVAVADFSIILQKYWGSVTQSAVSHGASLQCKTCFWVETNIA